MRSQGSKNVIYIAEREDGSPIGQIRFDVRPDGDLDVGVSLDKKMRGLGMAAQVIESGVRHAITKGPCICIHAFVKPGNIASVKAFERAAFRNIGSDQIRGNAAIHLTYVRN
jgi:RimJ/RimL family protein N-acetyltransferase